jgi:hypothetical protein
VSMGHIGIGSDGFAAALGDAPTGSSQYPGLGGPVMCDASSQPLPPTLYDSANGDEVDKEHARLLEEYERQKSRLDAEHQAKIEGLRRKQTATSGRSSADFGGPPSASPPSGVMPTPHVAWSRNGPSSGQGTPQSGTPGLVSETTPPTIPADDSRVAGGSALPPAMGAAVHLSQMTLAPMAAEKVGVQRDSRPCSPGPAPLSMQQQQQQQQQQQARLQLQVPAHGLTGGDGQALQPSVSEAIVRDMVDDASRGTQPPG